MGSVVGEFKETVHACADQEWTGKTEYRAAGKDNTEKKKQIQDRTKAHGVVQTHTDLKRRGTHQLRNFRQCFAFCLRHQH